MVTLVFPKGPNYFLRRKVRSFPSHLELNTSYFDPEFVLSELWRFSEVKLTFLAPGKYKRFLILRLCNYKAYCKGTCLLFA